MELEISRGGRHWLRMQVEKLVSDLGFQRCRNSTRGRENLVDILRFAKVVPRGLEMLVFVMFKEYDLMHVHFEVGQFSLQDLPEVIHPGFYKGRLLFHYNVDCIGIPPSDCLPAEIPIGDGEVDAALLNRLRDEIARADKDVWGDLWDALLSGK